MTKKGYTVTEWQQLRDTDLSFLGEGITAVGPFAGITSNALAHLRDDWISWREDHVRINVPETAPCNSYQMVGGDRTGLAPLDERDRPCEKCRVNGTTNEFENHWQAGGEGAGATVEPHNAILHRELAAPAVDFLETVFQDWDRPELGITNSAISYICSQADPDIKEDTYSYSKLRRTGPVIYAHYGLSARDIADLLPYSARSVEHIVQRTPGVNLSQHSTLSFLRAINQNEPVTVQNLMEELDRSRPVVCKRLNNLKEEGRVKVENGGPGGPTPRWSTVEDWAAPFRCEECDFETRSLTGIRTHRSQVH